MSTWKGNVLKEICGQALGDRPQQKEVKLLDGEEKLRAAGDELVERWGEQRGRGVTGESGDESEESGHDGRSGVAERRVEEGPVGDGLVDGGGCRAFWRDGDDLHGLDEASSRGGDGDERGVVRCEEF